MTTTGEPGFEARIKLSSFMKSFLERAAEVTYSTPRQALDRLMVQIELLAKSGDLNLGLEWTEAMRFLLGKPLTEEVPLAFDASILEPSKNKAGYAGVYGTGSSFRALVPDLATGGTKYLPSHPTAMAAAIERFYYFEKHGIPYGNLGKIVDKYRSENPTWDIEQALLAALDFLGSADEAKGLRHSYTRQQVEDTLERYRARSRSKPTVASVNRDSQKLEATVVDPKCMICDKLLADDQNVTFYGAKGDGLAHLRCVNQ